MYHFLPMLYNWVKGDFTLVGVRPLSFQYLSMYDKDLQELRKKVRPGLVPPFYADLPETFEEICDSERRYIQSFLAHPVKTQVVYFWIRKRGLTLVRLYFYNECGINNGVKWS